MLRLFTTTGRLRRRTYLGWALALYALAIVCYSLPVLAETQLGDAAPHWKTIALGGLAMSYYLLITQSVKRLHDLDLRGWWLLLALVPIASLVLGIGMQFVSGTDGPNRFGADPRQPQLATASSV